jgi:hypothetical protein
VAKLNKGATMFIEQESMVEYKGKSYVQKHGSPFDRGSADSYYGRGLDPHYYPNGTGNAPKLTPPVMTEEQVEAYKAGYAFNEECGDKKNWG